MSDRPTAPLSTRPGVDVLVGLLSTPSVKRLQAAMDAAEKKHGRPTNAAAIADADPAIRAALELGLALEPYLRTLDLALSAAVENTPHNQTTSRALDEVVGIVRAALTEGAAS